MIYWRTMSHKIATFAPVKKTVTIYGASSADIDPRYCDAGRETGRLLAGAGQTLICGGGRYGLMGAAIEGAAAEGGEIIGVLPRFMDERGWDNPALTRKVVTDGMHSRKEWMLTNSDAVIATPGGVGTFDELIEAITWRKLNLWQGNIVILNTLGYFDPLIEMLERSVEQRFMNPDHRQLWTVADTPAQAVAAALGQTGAEAPDSFSQTAG